VKKLILAVAIVAVLAMAFTSVGYAYTASTENSNNSVTSQYVTLTQQNYTFAGGVVSFDVIETEAGIKYQLNGETFDLTDIEGQGYMGVRIGSDELLATMTGDPGGVLEVAVSSPDIGDGWFTDYSGDLHGWKYVLKVTAKNPTAMSAVGIDAIGSPTVGEYYKVSAAGTIGTLGTVPAGSVVGYDGSAWVLMPDQYAYYNGAEGGTWVVKGQTIESDYLVQATDADAGGYIKLYNTDAIRDINVFVIDGSYTVHKIPITDISRPIDLVEEVGDGPWYVDGRVITDGKYMVESTDTDAGCNIVIYKNRSASNYTVVKIDNGTAELVQNKAAGAPVEGVSGWYHGGGVEFRILTGVTYTTELYFAGAGGNISSSLRSEGATIKVPSQITIMPEWTPVTASDISSRAYVKYTLNRGDGGVGADRVVYVKSGSNVILPENCFTAPQGKVFVGWKADNLDKIYTSEHIYTNFTSERTFTAQWAAADDCWTVTFDKGVGGSGEMEDRYILKNADSGNTFTLPPYEFTGKGLKFTGWSVSGASDRKYSEYNTYFVDIPAVKEDLTVIAQWEEAGVGAEGVAISFGSNTVIKVASNGEATVLSGMQIGDTVTGVQNWFVKGRPITEDPYTLRDSDVVHGGYIVIYQTANAADTYSVIEIEGDSAKVLQGKQEDDKIHSVGGWMVNGSLVYAAPYYVNADDADLSRFIVAYEVANAKGEYTVIKIPTTSGSPSITRGLHVGDSVTGVTGWFVNGGNALAGNYTITNNDANAINGFIVICESQNYNGAGKYAVVKAAAGGVAVYGNLDPDDTVSGVKGWKVKGAEVGTYIVDPDDAADIGGGYILLYDNAAADYQLHATSEGYYKLPYCIMAPPDDPGLMNFKGWKLMGWEVITTPGRSVPQSFTMPDGTDGYIVKNGTIKFDYKNDLRNGEEQV